MLTDCGSDVIFVSGMESGATAVRQHRQTVEHEVLRVRENDELVLLGARRHREFLGV